MIGYREIFIENYDKIITYNSKLLVLATGCGRLQLQGKQLMISYYSKSDMRVIGCINEIRFQS
ncbi:MAG: YabP/YqfC family sporulation protein [Lachnospiraceae bacterium]|nr:YabP/YqfC family sporulation protein [Lachnospiraceae bacterium]